MFTVVPHGSDVLQIIREGRPLAVADNISKSLHSVPRVLTGACGSVVGESLCCTSRNVAGSIPDDIIFSNSPNPSSCNMALGSPQPLTEMSTKNLPGGKQRPARKVYNITAICEPIV
jgi:hypothetical protein